MSSANHCEFCQEHSGRVVTEQDHERRLNSLENTIYGNGNEGLKMKVERILNWIANSENDRRLKITLALVLMAGLFNIFSALITLWK
jgi:hypothetical protein